MSALRILIVDDEVDLADASAIMLSTKGFQATALYTPEEALDVFARDPAAWDVVIVDQSMPGIDGLTLTRHLKELKPAVRVVLCTGFSEIATEDAARGAGAAAFFHKPVDTGTLINCLKSLFPPA